MITIIVVVAILLSICLVGFLRLAFRNKRITESYDFIREYLEKFRKFSTSQNFDDESYVWLTKNAYSIQAELGNFGVVSYKPPFQNYYINNYQIFINILPEIRRAKLSPSMLGPTLELRAMHENSLNCVEALLRYSGLLEDSLEAIGKDLRNPLIWFREGIGFILLFPITILQLFGIISSSVVDRILFSFIYRIISGIIAIITILSSFMTIILGWNEFQSWAWLLLHNLF